MPLINTITIDYCQILLSDSCPLGSLFCWKLSLSLCFILPLEVPLKGVLQNPGDPGIARGCYESIWKNTSKLDNK